MFTNKFFYINEKRKKSYFFTLHKNSKFFNLRVFKLRKFIISLLFYL